MGADTGSSRSYAHTTPAAQSGSTVRPIDAPLQVLIVDDDVVDRQVVRRGLAKTAGYSIEFSEASTFAEAVSVLKRQSFDCVFLDFRLPGGDGLQVLREVREFGVRAPIIMLTGQGDEQLAVELMKAGASDYLSKGNASAPRLGQTLRHAVRLHRAEAQAREADTAREVAFTARGRFYAAMSHELRTPSTRFSGTTSCCSRTSTALSTNGSPKVSSGRNVRRATCSSWSTTCWTFRSWRPARWNSRSVR